MNITAEQSHLLTINGITFEVNAPISLVEIKSTLLHHLGVPNYSSLNGFKTPVTIYDMCDVTGSNVYRWYSLRITVEVTYNESETTFQVIITHDNQINTYKFSKKDDSGFGYLGFINKLSKLLIF